MLTVKREDAVKLFEALDYHTASKWPNERMSEKLLGLKKMMDDDSGVEDADLKKLLNKVLKAEEITVTGDAPEAAPAKPAKAEKPAKASKAKPAENDDDEEETPPAKPAKGKAKPAAEDDEDDEEETPPAKPAKGKAKPAAKPVKEAKGPSERKRVYLLWKEIPKKERVDADANALRKKAKIDEERLPYVARWIRDWNRGKFLLKNDE